MSLRPDAQHWERQAQNRDGRGEGEDEEQSANRGTDEEQEEEERFSNVAHVAERSAETQAKSGFTSYFADKICNKRVHLVTRPA